MADKAKTEEEIELNMPLEKFLSTCFLVPMGDPHDVNCIWGLPVMLHGSPGIGKTARIRQASHTVGLTCKSVELGGRQPEDAGGAPFVTKDKNGNDVIVIACILPAINELNALGAGVLFLDELTGARPSTQGAFLTAVQERRVGDTMFSRRIRVVAAGNPIDQGAGAYTIQPPMANRMAHRNVLKPSVDDFVTYMIQGPTAALDHISDGEQQVQDNWANEYSLAVGHIAGFLRALPGHLHAIPKIGQASRGKAFPTPRSVEYATRAIATARILKRDSSEQTEMFASCVGSPAAIEWDSWVTKAGLPDPAYVLKNGWKPDTKRLDRTVAVYSSISAFVVGQPSKEEKITIAPKAWERLNDLIGAGLADLALPPAKALVQAGLSTKASKEIAEAARPVMLYFGKKGLQDFV